MPCWCSAERTPAEGRDIHRFVLWSAWEFGRSSFPRFLSEMPAMPLDGRRGFDHHQRAAPLEEPGKNDYPGARCGGCVTRPRLAPLEQGESFPQEQILRDHNRLQGGIGNLKKPLTEANSRQVEIPR